MKILLLITILMVSCGRKSPSRPTRFNTPIYTQPSHNLAYTCSRSYYDNQTIFNCYSNRETCILKYWGNYVSFGTWKCKTRFGQFEELALDLFKCSKSSGGGQHMLNCRKQDERCYLSYGRIIKHRCEIFEL